MRKKMIIFMASLWLVAFVSMIFTSKEGNEELDFVMAFSNEKYMYTESAVYGEASVGNMYYTPEEKKEYLDKVAKELGLNTEYSYTEERKDDVITSKIEKVAKNAITVIEFVTVETVKEKNIITLKNYLRIRIDISNSLDSAIAYKEIIEKVYTNKNIAADVFLNLKGSIQGELSNVEKNNIIDKIMSKLNADIVTSNRTDELYVVYGYSDDLKDYVVFGSTKTNVNVAITYDEINNESMIYMATPIINEDF